MSVNQVSMESHSRVYRVSIEGLDQGYIDQQSTVDGFCTHNPFHVLYVVCGTNTLLAGFSSELVMHINLHLY